MMYDRIDVHDAIYIYIYSIKTSACEIWLGHIIFPTIYMNAEWRVIFDMEGPLF